LKQGASFHGFSSEGQVMQSLAQTTHNCTEYVRRNLELSSHDQLALYNVGLHQRMLERQRDDD
jgi:hypothetical protein